MPNDEWLRLMLYCINLLFTTVGELHAKKKENQIPISESRFVLKLSEWEAVVLAELKLEAAIWQIESIFIQDKYLGFKFGNLPRFETLAKQKNGILRIVDDQTAFVTLKSTNISPPKMLALVKSILQIDEEGEFFF